eukprot:CAMPEP_0196769912 /NCGR_PEP_ID=MMETSP1104-20130614/820_1 /TAXON_ID=33652 /ORGANISM="Cafeteria sp., Strain Caron Lab Isolate" /LENGTH=485 /DNA_ID=CAMNT_0042140015 /DNA_START=40 /DNA_END=1497 /DNA_ORIENTATION=-
MDLDCIDDFAQFDLPGVDSFRSLDDMMGGLGDAVAPLDPLEGLAVGTLAVNPACVPEVEADYGKRMRSSAQRAQASIALAAAERDSVSSGSMDEGSESSSPLPAKARRTADGAVGSFAVGVGSSAPRRKRRTCGGGVRISGGSSGGSGGSETGGKKNDRKERNRESAKRSRERKRQYVETLEGKVQELQQEVFALRRKVRELSDANNRLRTENAELRGCRGASDAVDAMGAVGGGVRARAAVATGEASVIHIPRDVSSPSTDPGSDAMSATSPSSARGGGGGASGHVKDGSALAGAFLGTADGDIGSGDALGELLLSSSTLHPATHAPASVGGGLGGWGSSVALLAVMFAFSFLQVLPSSASGARASPVDMVRGWSVALMAPAAALRSALSGWTDASAAGRAGDAFGANADASGGRVLGYGAVAGGLYGGGGAQPATDAFGSAALWLALAGLLLVGLVVSAVTFARWRAGVKLRQRRAERGVSVA